MGNPGETDAGRGGDRGGGLSPTPRGVRRRHRLAGVLLLGILAAPSGWWVTDWLERDDDFCNACHLPTGVPLHVDVRRDFDAPVAATLAGVHGLAPVEGRDFRCIDCHGGVSLVGRARVKALAAKDAFWWLTGHFEEPTGMRWPLWDEDCTRCHASFDPAAGEAWEAPRFHALAVHNVDLGVACVECHLSHEAGGDPAADFVVADHVRAQCARCHAEFEEGEE